MNKIQTFGEIFEEYFYSKGYAVCQSDIIHDLIYFKFRDEQYEIPTQSGWRIVKPGWQCLWELGYKFDAAPIEKVRELWRKMKHPKRKRKSKNGIRRDI